MDHFHFSQYFTFVNFSRFFTKIIFLNKFTNFKVCNIHRFVSIFDFLVLKAPCFMPSVSR